MVKVKICGITLLSDALAALTAGADYLGFILYPPSPRAITVEALAKLVTALRHLPASRERLSRPDPPLLVGVFVNEPVETIADTLERCGLDLAQLSGNESPAVLTEPVSPLHGRAYKALRPRSLSEANAKTLDYAHYIPTDWGSRPRLLLDTPHNSLYGGSGQTGDWTLAAAVAASTPGLMLAGGLNPENVAEAVRQVRPFAVDVAGGVESAPGIKDENLVHSFITNAKTAN